MTYNYITMILSITIIIMMLTFIKHDQYQFGNIDHNGLFLSYLDFLFSGRIQHGCQLGQMGHIWYISEQYLHCYLIVGVYYVKINTNLMVVMRMERFATTLKVQTQLDA